MSTANPTCTEIAADVNSQKRSARELAETALARAEKFQEPFRAFTKITPEIAKRHAANADELLAAEVSFGPRHSSGAQTHERHWSGAVL